MNALTDFALQSLPEGKHSLASSPFDCIQGKIKDSKMGGKRSIKVGSVYIDFYMKNAPRDLCNAPDGTDVMVTGNVMISTKVLGSGKQVYDAQLGGAQVQLQGGYVQGGSNGGGGAGWGASGSTGGGGGGNDGWGSNSNGNSNGAAQQPATGGPNIAPRYVNGAAQGNAITVASDIVIAAAAGINLPDDAAVFDARVKFMLNRVARIANAIIAFDPKPNDDAPHRESAPAPAPQHHDEEHQTEDDLPF